MYISLNLKGSRSRLVEHLQPALNVECSHWSPLERTSTRCNRFFRTSGTCQFPMRATQSLPLIPYRFFCWFVSTLRYFTILESLVPVPETLLNLIEHISRDILLLLFTFILCQVVWRLIVIPRYRSLMPAWKYRQNAHAFGSILGFSQPESTLLFE